MAPMRGLPRRMADIGLGGADRPTVVDVAEVTCREAPYVKNLVRPLSPDRLVACLLAAEKL